MSQLSVQVPSAEGHPPLRLLVVGNPGKWPYAVRETAQAPGVVTNQVDTPRQACDPALLSRTDAVIICVPDGAEQANLWEGEMRLLADALYAHRQMGIVLSSGTSGVVPGEGDAIMTLSPDVSPEEIWGRVAAGRQYRTLLMEMEQQVQTMQRMGEKLSQHFSQVDQELRLASRLQRDFLPRSFPEVGEIRFAAMYRPATWVSGDVYDIKRLDETRLSCYIADAVGHGVAAGLLTMFIRQALVGKRVEQRNYTILPPDEVLAALNTAMVEQELPSDQFVTACYCVVNANTGELTFARGGHPHPIHISANGECTEARTVGGLLGVFGEEVYPSASLILQPGEKFVIYSDGLEDTLLAGHDRDTATMTVELLPWAKLSGPDMIAALETRLDQSEGSLQQADDQTCLVVERLIPRT